MIVKITKTCPFCNNENSVSVYQSQIDNRNNGALIQDAFPDKSATEREILKTGICGTCWDETFNNHK